MKRNGLLPNILSSVTLCKALLNKASAHAVISIVFPETAINYFKRICFATAMLLDSVDEIVIHFGEQNEKPDSASLSVLRGTA